MANNNLEMICDICGVAFTDKSKLKKHFERHRKLKCNVENCGKEYLSLNNLKYHLKFHFDKNYFIVCFVCGKKVSKWKLSRHLERHNPNKDTKVSEQQTNSYVCRYCGLTFDKVNNRTSHEKRIHKVKSKFGVDNFKCVDCSLTFRTKEELRKHSFEHFSGKIHFCDFPGCTRYFKKGKLVTVHKRCHYEPQFKCIDCGSLFVQKAGLSKHQKERCPAKKLVTDKPSTEELEKIANTAKEQFINLNGRIVNSSKSKEKSYEDLRKITKELSSDYLEETSPKNPIEFQSSENKEQLKNETISEDWQYEFLDEAMLELSSIENSQIFVESINEVSSSDQYRNEKESNVLVQPKIIVKAKFENLEKKYICDYCGKTDISSKNHLQKHLQTHRKENKHKATYMCTTNDCKEAFSNKSLLIQHKRGYHGLRIGDRKISEPYICDFCGKEYWTRSSIVTHLLVTHKTLADFKCHLCCRTFKSHGNLSRHIKIHNNDKSFGCEKCGAMFKEKYQLEIHIHNHDEPTECNICGKMVSNIKVHLRHHASKINNTIVKCPMCEKMIGKYQLIRHIKAVHEKQYQCDSSKANLKVYTCKDCGDFFSRKHELRQHEYINHSQSKIYKCNICGTYFKKLKLLNVHRFSHQPLNISCEICNNVYARKGALLKHQKKHHPELVMKKKLEGS